MANPQDLYNQALGSAQQMYGFDPRQLLQANQNLARTNTTIANLPQAIQQQGNYYGTTAGAEANNYANMAGNLNSVQQGQANTANAFQNVLAATQNQANQAATLGYQGEQLKSQNYGQLYTSAVQQMQAAGQTLNQLETLQQQQGNLTAQQVAAYQNALSTYVGAQASAAQAYATAAQLNQQVGFANQVHQKYGVGGIANMLGVPQSVTNPAQKTSNSKPSTNANKPNTAVPSRNYTSTNILGQPFKL